MNEIDPYRTAVEFHRRLQREIDEAAGDGSAESATFRGYYRGIERRERHRPFYEHNWADRLVPAVESIDRPGMRVLDAGCGTGTESLFFAGLGCRVTGVDLNTARVAAARWRAGRADPPPPGSVEFVNGDIARIERREPFDIVWSMESVSHIEPLDGFIETAARMLAPGGRIIVSDTNGLNPWFQLKALKERGLKVYEYVEDEETGRMVRYANERLVPVSSMERKLVRAGFRLVSTRMSGFLPPRAVLAAGRDGTAALEALIRKIPVLPLFGGVFTVVAAS